MDSVRKKERDAKRFAAGVDRSGGQGACWPWTRSGERYGRFHVHPRTVSTHRYAYEQEFGPIPDGMCVCHRCDNPRCCNPAHLFLGTTQDNTADRHAKGRDAAGDRSGSRLHPERLCRGDAHPARRTPGWRRGENNGRAILTEDDVRAIKNSPRTYGSRDELAKRFGVTTHAIARIRAGRAWGHVI